ncbi:MAG: putative transposase DNA-binding domain protein [Candidatus Bathyarchaeota archaeon BA1]|nr:MAG: putative transposase DNA-binding domain protein [Candidatus Bathyarchaeota archaeon BA1]
MKRNLKFLAVLSKDMPELYDFVEFDANIATEKLRRLKKRKGERSKRSTRQVNSIPYGFFRHALKHVDEREVLVVKEIKAHYTSQTCPRCGYVDGENWKRYSCFRCVRCGCEADRDRTASLNIAERAGFFFTRCSQTLPLRSAPVNGHVWKDEMCERQRQITRVSSPFLSEGVVDLAFL